MSRQRDPSNSVYRWLCGGLLRVAVFSGMCGIEHPVGLQSDGGPSYVECRRGTEPQRARPLRCEAAPPARKGPRAGPTGFLKVAWDRVYFCLQPVGKHAPRDTLERQYTLGADRLRRGRLVAVVASRGPGRPRKTPGKNISADSHEYALAA